MIGGSYEKKGFTLIELVVVIALIAILAVTLAPRLRNQIAKAKDTEAISALGALRTLSETYYADEQVVPYGEYQVVKIILVKSRPMIQSG